MSHSTVAEAINWWAWDAQRSPMGWFLFDFGVFLALLAYCTAKPLRQALSERHHSVRRAVTQAAASHAKAIGEQQLWAQKLAGLDGDLRQLEEESRTDGEAEAAQMRADAQRVAAQLLSDAQLQAEQELRRAHEAVRQQSLAEVLARAEHLVAQAINQGDQRELIETATRALPHLSFCARRKKQTMGSTR